MNIKVSRDSWHYKLASYDNHSLKYYDNTNVCEYTKSVLWGLVIIILITLLGLFMLAAIVNAIFVPLNYFFNWFPSNEQMIGSAVSIWVVVGIGLTYHGLIMILDAKLYAKKKEPGFIKMNYMRFKNKVCAFVEFK